MTSATLTLNVLLNVQRSLQALSPEHCGGTVLGGGPAAELCGTGGSGTGSVRDLVFARPDRHELSGSTGCTEFDTGGLVERVFVCTMQCFS